MIAFVMPNLPETHWVIWGGEAAGIVFAIKSFELEISAHPRPSFGRQGKMARHNWSDAS